MAKGGWVCGVRADRIQIEGETRDAGQAQSGGRPLMRALTGRSPRGADTYAVRLFFTGDAREERVRAASVLLEYQHPVILEREDVDLWRGYDAVACVTDGEFSYQEEGQTGILSGTLEIMGSVADANWFPYTRSVIQENAFSTTGETRLMLPGQGKQISGGGSVVSAGKWATDPDSFSGVSYAKDEPITNFEAPSEITLQPKDWNRWQPALVTRSHMNDQTAEGSDTGDPSTVDISNPAYRVVAAEAEYDWDGGSPAIDVQAEVAWGTNTLSTQLAPTGSSSGTFQFLYSAWLPRSSENPDVVRFESAGSNTSSLSVQAWDLDRAWDLDQGNRYSDFLATYGAGKVYVDGGAFLAYYPRLNGSALACSILLNSGASWWRLRHVTPHYIRLRSDQGDELRVWVNGLVEFTTPSSTFDVQPADSSKSTGSSTYRPHSNRDLRLVSLEDYTASVTSEVATVSETVSEQRYGLGWTASPDHFFRRTRQTWRQEV